MKYGAQYLVMRYAPRIGQPATARRYVRVVYRAYTLADALSWAARGAGNCWIVDKHKPAHHWR